MKQFEFLFVFYYNFKQDRLKTNVSKLPICKIRTIVRISTNKLRSETNNKDTTLYISMFHQNRRLNL